MDLDERLTLSGAEGVDIDLVLAGLGSRGSALIIDLALQSLAVFLLAWVGSLFENSGLVIVAVGTFLVLLGYPTLAEAFAGGQTVGKRIMSIAVVRDDGSPATFLAAVVRNVVRVIDSLPGVYLIGCVSVWVSSRNQRVGDIAAGTIVIRRARRADRLGPTSFEDLGIEPVRSPEVVGWDVSAVTAEEVAAMRSFLVRRTQLDPEHRARLAQTLAFQVMHKVAGVPLDGGPEHFLERIVAAKSSW